MVEGVSQALADCTAFEIINIVGIGYHKVSYWENQSWLFVMPLEIRGS